MTSLLPRTLPRWAAACAAVCLTVGCSASPSATPETVATTTLAPASTTIAPTECQTARAVADVLSTTDFSDQAGIEALPESIRSLQNVVPPELGTDVETLAAALDDFVALLREYEFDLEKIDNDPTAQARLGEMNDPEVTAATQRIQDWLDTSCASS